MKRSILALALGAGLTGTILAQAQAPALAEVDLKFVETVASKGLMEVALSQHAADHGVSPDVKLIGQQMVTDHSKANEELASIATNKGLTLAKESRPEHKEILDRVTGLSGEEFDKQYIETMARGHQESLDAIEKFQVEGIDPDIKGFAQKIQPIVEHHLEMVKNAQEGKPLHQAREELKEEPSPGL